MLTIENLYFSYTGSAPWLLENVDFHLAGGEYISIVGNNGSGKSTLLKIILGFLKPVSGTVTRRARRIGYVPQRSASDASFPITVEEVIHSYGKLLHLKKIDVDQVLSVTGMEGYKKQLMGSLSGGQHQKVLIARALMGSPDLLILDEPSTGVDLTSPTSTRNSIPSIRTRALPSLPSSTTSLRQAKYPTASTTSNTDTATSAVSAII